MFVYTSAPYPAYSPPPMFYPGSYYVTPPPAVTSRARYLRALAGAQAARDNYIAELEEEHISASLREQEAQRQAECRQRRMIAPRNVIIRRRGGRPYANDGCQYVPFSPQARRQVVATHQRTPAQKPQEPTPFYTLEDLYAAILGGRGGDDEQDNLREQRRLEEARAEQARKAAIHNARDRFANKLEAIREEVQAARGSRSVRPFSESTGPGNESQPSPIAADPSGPSAVPLTRQPEIPRNRTPRERAARTIQGRWRSHSADAAARKDALATISTLLARFQFLKDTFSFPEDLEFKEHASTEQEQHVATLMFTPANAAVHAYIHELTKLLTLADAIPSYGSHQVREERRKFVRLVEETLDSIDRRVEKVWGKKVESGGDASATSVAVDAPQTTSGREVDSSQTQEVEAVDATPSESEVLVSSTHSDISDSTSTVIPSRVDHAAVGTNSSFERPSQDTVIPDTSKEAVLDEAVVIQADVTVGNHSREEAAAVRIQANNRIDADEAAAPKNEDPVNESSPNYTSLSVLQAWETPLTSALTNIEVDTTHAFPSSKGEDVDSSVSPVPIAAESFDVVHPDSPSSTSLTLKGDVELQNTAHDVPILSQDEAPSKEVTDDHDDEFELL